MPETIAIEYDDSLSPAEAEQLRGIEPAVRAALENHHIFGLMRWIAQVDLGQHLVFVLRRVSDSEEMLTYLMPHEFPGLDPAKIDRYIFAGRRTYPSTLSERPLVFESLSLAEQAKIVNARLDVTILVPRSATKHGKISTYERSPFMPTHVEIPPTGMALTDSGAARVVANAPRDLEGAWMRMFIATYRAGGRIFFREIDPQTIEAVFRFDRDA